MYLGGKHLSEFARAFRNRRFEKADNGLLLFPEQKCFVGGVGAISRNGGPAEPMDNLVVLQGRIYMLTAALLAGAQQGAWYVAPFATNTAVADTLTAANFNSTLVEFVNYSETTRQAWTAPAPSGSSVLTNAASLATITISNGVQTAVYGATLQSVSARGGGTGICFCGMQAPTPKIGLELGETLSFSYGIAATSS
jgi:hypothetical protein